jgi:putative adhesin
MSNPICMRLLAPAMVLMLLVAGTPAFVSAADFRNQLDVDPQGTVEINGIGGKVEILAWDQAKIEVTGSDDLADRIDIHTLGSRTVIEMRPHRGAGIGADTTRMTVHVPARSSVSGTWVSATVKVDGIGGETNLRTVSGDLSGEVGGDLKANTATGNIRMVARGAKSIEVKTISGDVQLTAGTAAVELSTVSGNAKLELATLTRGHMKSISGDLTGQFALAPDADFESESVSGNVRLTFPAPPAAYYDIQSISGTIDNCFGPKVERAEYGPGARLDFKTGDAKAHVRIGTKSGDVKICAA